MEFLEGRDLRAELEKVGRLSPEETAAYLLPIASALAYAHRVGAVHRDIKPANVFLAHDPRDQIVPKVVDFGLSKLEDVPESRPLTESEMVVGSVAYMAPEQTYGIGNAGAPADQFSFGCVLYECLTGRAPFRARSFFQLVEAVRAAKVEPPSRVVPGLPPAVDAIVARALAVDPADRFPSMRALGAELLALADEGTREAWSVDFEDTPRPRAKVVASPRRVRVAPVVPDEDCPALPRPAGTSPFQIKGIPYRGLAYLVSRTLPHGLDDLCEALDDAALREFVRQPFLASSRYDVLPIRPLMMTLARLLGRPSSARCWAPPRSTTGTSARLASARSTTPTAASTPSASHPAWSSCATRACPSTSRPGTRRCRPRTPRRPCACSAAATSGARSSGGSPTSRSTGCPRS
jgi:hypothetical protein